MGSDVCSCISPSIDERSTRRGAKGRLSLCRGSRLSIAAYHIENESGATLKRPELNRLINDAHPGDVLLIEQVDRLSRLNGRLAKLQSDLKAKHMRVVALDLPTSWQVIKDGDDFSRRLAEAINGMMLEMLAAFARKDYEDGISVRPRGSPTQRQKADSRVALRTPPEMPNRVGVKGGQN